MLTYVCQNDLRSSVSIFNACLIDAWERSSSPTVSACFVVACFRVIPRRPATSLITCHVKTVPLSEKSVLGM